MQDELGRSIAEAVLGVDTLWGGDVFGPSGADRLIADSWFSDEPQPRSYSHPTAAAVRATGGLSAAKPDLGAISAYLKAVDVAGAVAFLGEAGPQQPQPRGSFLEGLAMALQVIWDLAQAELGRGDAVPYERAVVAATAQRPSPSEPTPKLERLGVLLDDAGYGADSEEGLRAAVQAWRSDRLLPAATIPMLARALVAELDAGAARHVMPHLPHELQGVPRANVKLQPIKDAFFSGAMSYLGQARTADGRPEYEALCEINASLEMSAPELYEMVCHEVVPGHVTTFAFIQHLSVLGRIGFEGTVLTLNSRHNTLVEGIANNAALLACGVTELKDLPEPDLEITMVLALLQDDAKNQASFLTWAEHAPQPEVAEALRRDFLLTDERADKVSGPWAHHPVLGRMNLPAYRAGTELVARLLREYRPEELVPVLFSCAGLVDMGNIESVLEGQRR